MDTVKVLVTGPFNSGKTEFIRTISEIDVMPAELKSVNAVGEDTLIPLDFGRLTLTDNYALYLFATLSSRRMSLDMYARLQLDGLVMLVDSALPITWPEAAGILNQIRAYAAAPPWVVVANKQDMPHVRPPKEIRDALYLSSGQPLLLCNSRHLPNVRDVLLALCFIMPPSAGREILIEKLKSL